MAKARQTIRTKVHKGSKPPVASMEIKGPATVKTTVKGKVHKK
jgi:hypothetical protein